MTNTITGWHRGPMIGLDFETTGLDVEEDRIVTACIAFVDGTGTSPTECLEVINDPGIPIPDKAVEIHGWSIDRVRAHPFCTKAKDGVEFIAASLAAALRDQPTAPLVGHNIGSYDLTLLDRELRRHDLPLLEDQLDGRPLHVVDTFVLSKHLDPYRKRVSAEQGAHQLKTCAQVYGLPWSDDEAHGSTYDALMSARVAWRMANANPHIARMPLAALHDAQGRWKREQEASYAAFLRRKGETPTGLDGHWPIKPFEGQQELAS